MVARFARFRIGYLLALFNGAFKRKAFNFLGLVIFFGAAFLLAWYPVEIAEGSGHLKQIDSLVGALVFILIVGFVFFNDRFSLATRSFQTIAASSNAIAAALITTSFITWPFLIFSTWAVTFLVLRADIYPIFLAAIAFVSLAILLIFTLRFAASFSKLIFRTERGLLMRRGFGAVLLTAALPLMAYLTFLTISGDHTEDLGQVATVTNWLPLGFILGLLQEATLNMAGSVALLGVLLAITSIIAGLTFSLLLYELRSVPKPGNAGLKQVKLGWFGVFPATVSGAIGARAMLYWLKDPRYRISIIAIPVIPFTIVTILKFVGVSVSVLAFLPLPIVLIMIAWMVHNDVAHDATAFWLHVASGIKGWQDRLGRLTPVFFFGIPILLIGTVVSAVLMDDWRLIASFFALGFVALNASSSVSSVTSILLPYPATRPGESPFMQPQWQGAGSGFAQTISLIAATLLTAPVIWFIVQYNQGENIISLNELLIGSSVYGLILILLGILIGGKIFDFRATSVLTLSQVYD